MKIALGSDHAGFAYKERIKALLASLGHMVCDFGTHSTEPVDYPAFIRPAAEAVARGECERGIVLGGSGNGAGNRAHLAGDALRWWAAHGARSADRRRLARARKNSVAKASHSPRR